MGWTKISKQELGAWGEQQAGNYLQRKGYIPLAKNYRLARGELDLVMSYQNYLKIIEVKTFSTALFGHPADMVNSHKLSQLRKLGCQLSIGKYVGWQIDVVAVYGNGQQVFDIIHYENVGIWE